jgi:hypothetical protein
MAITLALPWLPACGSVEGSDYKGESIFEIEGTATLAQGAKQPADVKVGLLWIHEEKGSDLSMQDSQVGATFPASFSLSLYANPPSSSLMTYNDMLKLIVPAEKPYLDKVWPQKMQVGFALVVIWEDTNNNGTFDNTLELGTTGNYLDGPDRVIGGSPDHVVGFVDGALPPLDFYTMPLEGGIDKPVSNLGYTLLKKTGKPNCYTVGGQQQCGSSDQLTPVPSTDPVKLVISSDPDALAKDPTSLFPNVALK